MKIRHAVLWAIIILLGIWFVSLVNDILLPFVLGAMMAYLLDPVVDKLETKQLNRGVATAIVTVVAFAILVMIFGTALPLIGEQLVNLLQVLPGQLRSLYDSHAVELETFLSSLRSEQEQRVKDALGDISGVAAEVVKDLSNTLFSSGAALLNLLSLLLITPVVAFYLLRDWDNIIANIDDLLPRKQAATIREQMGIMDETISGFLRGQMMVCSILATFYVIGLTIMGLNFSVVIGAAAGFLIIIPYAGWAAAAGVGMVIAFMQFDSMVTIGIIAGIFLVGQVIEGYILTPKLVGDRVGLHPVWIIFGMLAGAVLLGFVGVLLAIPMAAVIGVMIRFTLDRYKHSTLYLGDGSSGGA